MGSIPTINRKLNLQTHTSIHSRTYACMYTCMYTRRRQIVDEPTADVLLNWQMGTREKERGREQESGSVWERREREIRQSWLKSIVAVQVFVCTCASLSLAVYVCVCMYDSAWNVWKNAANDGNGNQTTLALPCLPACRRLYYVEFWNVQVSSRRVETFTLLSRRCRRLCTWHAQAAKAHPASKYADLILAQLLPLPFDPI